MLVSLIDASSGGKVLSSFFDIAEHFNANLAGSAGEADATTGSTGQQKTLVCALKDSRVTRDPLSMVVSTLLFDDEKPDSAVLMGKLILERIHVND